MTPALFITLAFTLAIVGQLIFLWKRRFYREDLERRVANLETANRRLQAESDEWKLAVQTLGNSIRRERRQLQTIARQVLQIHRLVTYNAIEDTELMATAAEAESHIKEAEAAPTAWYDRLLEEDANETTKR